MTSKIDKSLTFLVRKEQHDKLKLISYYSGISIGRLLRNAIDHLALQDFIKEKASEE
jgi:hypothetical protein